MQGVSGMEKEIANESARGNDPESKGFLELENR